MWAFCRPQEEKTEDEEFEEEEEEEEHQQQQQQELASSEGAESEKEAAGEEEALRTMVRDALEKALCGDAQKERPLVVQEALRIKARGHSTPSTEASTSSEPALDADVRESLAKAGELAALRMRAREALEKALGTARP